MSVELKEFHEGKKTFLATGFIEYQDDKDAKYFAQRANGEYEWFWDRKDATDFIAQGIRQPQQ